MQYYFILFIKSVFLFIKLTRKKSGQKRKKITS